jgi:hypothetical protein
MTKSIANFKITFFAKTTRRLEFAMFPKFARIIKFTAFPKLVIKLAFRTFGYGLSGLLVSLAFGSKALNTETTPKWIGDCFPANFDGPGPAQ